MKSLADPDVRTAVIERVKTVRPDSKPLWGRMNAHQMLCHLKDAFLAVLGEKQVSPATGLFQKTVMKFVALNAPFPWPKNIMTRPELDYVAQKYCPPDFMQTRRELIAQIERFSRPDLDLSGAVHPIFGNMSEWEWRRWAWLHMDHHLRQFGA
jgi:hypothetical protein